MRKLASQATLRPRNVPVILAPEGLWTLVDVTFHAADLRLITARFADPFFESVFGLCRSQRMTTGYLAGRIFTAYAEVLVVRPGIVRHGMVRPLLAALALREAALVAGIARLVPTSLQPILDVCWTEVCQSLLASAPAAFVALGVINLGTPSHLAPHAQLVLLALHATRRDHQVLFQEMMLWTLRIAIGAQM